MPMNRYSYRDPNVTEGQISIDFFHPPEDDGSKPAATFSGAPLSETASMTDEATPVDDFELYEEAAAPEPAPIFEGLAQARGTDAQSGLGEHGRAEANIEALQALALLRGGMPLDEDMAAALGRFSGWGGASDAFSDKEGWSAAAEAVDALMTDGERAAAVASTLTSFYTPKSITRALWSALQEMGFEGGRVLEPGCGAGNILRDAPEGMLKACEVKAIEIDPTAAEVAAALVPEADVVQADFTKADFAEGSFDVAIGNVPFSSVLVSGAGRSGLQLHDFYFLRALDAVKPGGVVAFVTSRGTMDKKSREVRAEIAARADLVAACRLPDGAFSAQAGTDVGTDVLVLRKREEGQSASRADWVETFEVAEGVRQNALFAEHPELVLGRTAVEVGRFGPQLVVRPDGRETGDALAESLTRQIGAAGARMGSEPPTEPFYLLATKPQAGSYEVEGGRILRNTAGGLVDVTPSKARDASALVSLVFLAQRARRQLDLERSGADDETCDSAREALADAYGRFAAEYGPINDSKNKKLMDDTAPEKAIVMALEVESETGAWEPAPILSRRVVAPAPEEDVRTPEDALAWSLGEFGEVCMGAMARKIDMDYGTLCEALAGKVYADVAGEGGWVTADEFLSGNVRRKLADNRSALDRLDDELSAAAERAWKREEGLPIIEPLSGEERRGLADYLGAAANNRGGTATVDQIAILPEVGLVDMSDVRAWAEVARKIPADAKAHASRDGDSFLKALRARVARAEMDAYSEATGEDVKGAYQVSMLATRERIDVVEGPWQAIWVAEGAAWAAGRVVDHSLTWEVAVQRAVGEAAMLLDSGKTIDDYARLEGYCAAAYAHDPSLGELAYRIAANPESAAARQLRAWYEQADSWALEKLGASEGASSSHAKLMLGKQRDAAFANAVRELAPAVESWRAERAAFIEGFSRSDSLAAAAWRSRRAHLEGNVAALSGTLPPDLSPAQISVSLGSTWMPADVVKDFVVQEVGLRFPFDADELDISYQAATAKWFVTCRAALSPKALEKWGTQRAHPIDILRSSLNCSRVVVKDDDPENDGKKAVNAAETAAAQAKQAALEERFADWCWEDEARAARLAAIYNERYNSIVPRTYHGADLKFPEMNPQIELRPWQRDAVARILYGKSGALLAHVVGAGKTMEFIAGAMESKRLGLCGKPMVVVPNHLVEQTAAAFTELYPAARVLAARKRDFEKERRREFTARVATGDWDAVVIGQSQFERIPLSSEARQAYISGQIERYQQADLAAREADGRKSRSVKEIAKARERLERKLDKLLDSSLKDDERGATFDMLGVDMLIVDEAHAYKNVELTTKMSRVAGVASAGSKRSEDMMSKVRWMQARHGERSVVFATGTPVSNSMVELYNMQRYLNPATLDSMGIGSFDEWATTFGRREAAFEITPEGGGYQMKERFSKFVNMPELMSAVETFADIKTASDVDLDLPECEVHAVAVEPTAEQKEAVEALIERAALVRDKKVAPEVDNMLKITGDGRKVALDARLLDPGSADDSVECGGKIAACAENVARIWRETAAERGCQLVFCDTSTPHSGRWNVYEELRGQLVAAGVDAADIAFVHDAGDKPEKKEELFARVRAGEVRVLIGSTEKMGTGTNVQDRLAATHDLDCPWRPADLEQRQGRILRQGNGYDKVDVYRYVCVGTFDSYLYQLVEGKQRFISQVFNRDPKVREVSDLDDAVTLSYAQMKAAAAGDDRIRERMELQNKVTRLSMLKDTHDSAVRRARELVERTLPARIEGLQKTLSDVQADLDELSTAEDVQGSWCGMTVGGEHFADKHDAGEALQRASRSLEAGASAILGEYRGLSVRAHMQQATGKPTIGLCGRLNWMTPNPIPVQPGRVPAALDRMAARIEKRAGEAAGALGDARAELAAARTRTEALFEHAAELEAARARIAELNVELGIEDEEAAAAAEQDAKARRAALAAERDAELDLKPLHGESADMKKRFVERFGFEPEFSNLELPGGEKPMRMDEVHAALVQLGLAARVGRGLSGEDGRRAAALAAYVELRAERGDDAVAGAAMLAWEQAAGDTWRFALIDDEEELAYRRFSRGRALARGLDDALASGREPDEDVLERAEIAARALEEVSKTDRVRANPAAKRLAELSEALAPYRGFAPAAQAAPAPAGHEEAFAEMRAHMAAYADALRSGAISDEVRRTSAADMERCTRYLRIGGDIGARARALLDEAKAMVGAARADAAKREEEHDGPRPAGTEEGRAVNVAGIGEEPPAAAAAAGDEKTEEESAMEETVLDAQKTSVPEAAEEARPVGATVAESNGRHDSAIDLDGRREQIAGRDASGDLLGELRALQASLLTHATAMRGGRRPGREQSEAAARDFARVVELAEQEGLAGKAARTVAATVARKVESLNAGGSARDAFLRAVRDSGLGKQDDGRLGGVGTSGRKQVDPLPGGNEEASRQAEMYADLKSTLRTFLFRCAMNGGHADPETTKQARAAYARVRGIAREGGPLADDAKELIGQMDKFFLSASKKAVRPASAKVAGRRRPDNAVRTYKAPEQAEPAAAASAPAATRPAPAIKPAAPAQEPRRRTAAGGPAGDDKAAAQPPRRTGEAAPVRISSTRPASAAERFRALPDENLVEQLTDIRSNALGIAKAIVAGAPVPSETMAWLQEQPAALKAIGSREHLSGRARSVRQDVGAVLEGSRAAAQGVIDRDEMRTLTYEAMQHTKARLAGMDDPPLTLGTLDATVARIGELAKVTGEAGQAALKKVDQLARQLARAGARPAHVEGMLYETQGTGARS